MIYIVKVFDGEKEKWLEDFLEDNNLEYQKHEKQFACSAHGINHKFVKYDAYSAKCACGAICGWDIAKE